MNAEEFTDSIYDSMKKLVDAKTARLQKTIAELTARVAALEVREKSVEKMIEESERDHPGLRKLR